MSTIAISPRADAGFVVIDGFRCYAPDLAGDASDYPVEGFDVSAQAEAASFWCRSRNRIIRRAVARFAAAGRDLDMLEIGCGIGGVIGELRRQTNLRLTGSEISLHGLRYARARFPDVEFVQLDATRMPFAAAFDVIGAFDVLEHVDDDERAIDGVRRALRPGGVFVVTVPQHAWMWSALDETVRHKRRYSRKDLLRKLRRARFDVLFCSSFVTALFPAMAVSRMLARTRRRDADRAARFAAEVTFSPAANVVCDAVMRLDEAAIRAGWSLPFGGSLLAVARAS